MTGGPFAAEEAAPITGGTLVPSNQHGPPDTSVIKIQIIDSSGGIHSCTALKVSSNVYWTAAHCLRAAGAGVTMSLTNNLAGDFSGPASYSRTIASADRHPSHRNYDVTFFLGNDLSHYDVGRFTLSGTTPAIPAYAATDSAWVEPNQAVTYTGYGCDLQTPSHTGQKQYAFFDLFDSASAQAIGLGPSFYIHNMVNLGDSPTGCDGDSGAPLFKKFGSTWKTVGTVAKGGPGYTGFARYSNVRRWLASPASNDFQVGFQGFIFNQYTGRCITAGITDAADSNCKGTDQNFDIQSWRLAESGWTADTFYLINGGTGKCLDIDTTADGAKLVLRACLPISQLINTQRWRFDPTSHADYRRLVNVFTDRCTEPSDPSSASEGINGDVFVSKSCTTAHPGWRYQAWVMTR